MTRENQNIIARLNTAAQVEELEPQHHNTWAQDLAEMTDAWEDAAEDKRRTASFHAAMMAAHRTIHHNSRRS